MIAGKYDYIKKWQNEVFDGKMEQDLQNALLSSEVKRLVVFLSQNGIEVPDELIEKYAKERNFQL